MGQMRCCSWFEALNGFASKLLKDCNPLPSETEGQRTELVDLLITGQYDQAEHLSRTIPTNKRIAAIHSPMNIVCINSITLL